MKIGQKYAERVHLRWTPLGLVALKWNVSVPALVANDPQQEWRFFGVRVLKREFGLAVRVRSE